MTTHTTPGEHVYYKTEAIMGEFLEGFDLFLTPRAGWCSNVRPVERDTPDGPWYVEPIGIEGHGGRYATEAEAWAQAESLIDDANREIAAMPVLAPLTKDEAWAIEVRHEKWCYEHGDSGSYSGRPDPLDWDRITTCLVDPDNRDLLLDMIRQADFDALRRANAVTDE